MFIPKHIDHSLQLNIFNSVNNLSGCLCLSYCFHWYLTRECNLICRIQSPLSPSYFPKFCKKPLKGVHALLNILHAALLLVPVIWKENTLVIFPTSFWLKKQHSELQWCSLLFASVNHSRSISLQIFMRPPHRKAFTLMLRQQRWLCRHKCAQ